MNLSTRLVGNPLIPMSPYVLLVDDEAASVEPLGEIVRSAGFPSVGVCSVIEALRCCFHRRPNVVVTDLEMPGYDGRELTRRLKRRYPSLPILMLTGRDLDHPDWRVRREHYEAIFAKPVDLDPFIRTLTRLMPRSDEGHLRSLGLDRRRESPYDAVADDGA